MAQDTNRVNLVVVDLGWVGLALILAFHHLPSSVGADDGRPRWWNFEIKVNSTQIHDHKVHPVQILM